MHLPQAGLGSDWSCVNSTMTSSGASPLCILHLLSLRENSTLVVVSDGEGKARLCAIGCGVTAELSCALCFVYGHDFRIVLGSW